MTVTLPFPDGAVGYPFLIATASNKDCWKQAANYGDSPVR